MAHDVKLVDDGAVRILMAEECTSNEEWARKALGIGEDLQHDGDCTQMAYTCRLCRRIEYQSLMRAALDAINASGTHWVAPWDNTRTNRKLMGRVGVSGDFDLLWDAMRDTYLAEQDEDDGTGPAA